MNIKGVTIQAVNWRKWVGVRWQNYELHQGVNPPRWSGFHIYLGFGALMVSWHYRLQRSGVATS